MKNRNKTGRWSASVFALLALVSTAQAGNVTYTIRVPVRGLAASSGTANPGKQIAQFAGYRAWSDGTYARNCNEYLNPGAGASYAGSVGNGVYTIAISGVPTQVVCDMSTSGGGWTKVVGASPNNRNHINTGASPWSAAVGSGGETGKLSDAAINTLKSSSDSTTIAYMMTSSGITSYFPGSCAFNSTTAASGDCTKYTNTYSNTPAWSTGASTSDGCSPPTYYTGLSSIKHAACAGNTLSGDSGNLIYGRSGNAPTNGMTKGNPYTGALYGELWVR